MLAFLLSAVRPASAAVDLFISCPARRLAANQPQQRAAGE